MKLLFPNGEHAPVDLKTGRNTIGADPGCDVVLSGEGIGGQHCELDLQGTQVVVRIADAQNRTLVNGTPVVSELPLKQGDLLIISRIHCRVVGIESQAAAPKAQNSDSDGATKVRMALPRFVLRGTSGSTFSKTFALHGSMVVGRSTDCEISIPTDEVSRRHAQLKVAVDGVHVEDLGSANGTFINGTRVRTGLLKPGDELRLDTVRFMLIVPGMEVQLAKKSGPAEAGGAGKPGLGLWLALAGGAAVVVIGALFAFGVI